MIERRRAPLPARRTVAELCATAGLLLAAAASVALVLLATATFIVMIR